MKLNKEKIAAWLFISVATTAFVIISFPTTPEVQAALSASVKTVDAEQVDKLYDVPLEADLQLHIKELCEAYGVDMPLVLAVIGQESNYDPEAIGDSGNSIGLMQIQPIHHQQRMDNLGVTDLLDPRQNVLVGIDLLAELLADSGDTEWAITAYNAGAGTADFNKKIGMRSEYAESVMILREEIENGR